MAEQWSVRGQYMEACTCDVLCPCIMLADPTGGTCTALVGWHVDRGAYGGLALDGLNLSLAIHTPGNMSAGNWTAAMYLDARATPEQRDALHTIWAGQAGGHPAHLIQLVGTVAGSRVVPIDFTTDGRKGRLKVGDAGLAEGAAIEGQGGQPVTVANHPLCVAPGFPAVVGRSTTATFNDFGITLDAAGQDVLISPFEYAGP
jgi:hypothetical protein